MARNRGLSAKTAKDIDERVERVLRGLGHPEPPLRLEDVRELLKLDREFYTAEDPGVLREAISRIRIAGTQVYRRPTLLIDAIRKASIQALYLPDRRRILLDSSLPKLKHRWNEGHEIGHSLIPWHQEIMLGDNSFTLTPVCQEEVEAEANFAAGRLLFLRERFTEEALPRTVHRGGTGAEGNIWQTAYAHGSGRESLPPDVEVEVRAGERVECSIRSCRRSHHMKQVPDSLLAFQHMFPDDDACAAWLIEMRWPDGFV